MSLLKFMFEVKGWLETYAENDLSGHVEPNQFKVNIKCLWTWDKIKFFKVICSTIAKSAGSSMLRTSNPKDNSLSERCLMSALQTSCVLHISMNVQLRQEKFILTFSTR